METFKRIDEKTIQKVHITEEIIDITDLERRRDEIQVMLNIDAQTMAEYALIRGELDKTNLEEHIKDTIMSRMQFSGTGVTPSMLTQIQAQIDALRGLPIETKVDIEKDGNIV